MLRRTDAPLPALGRLLFRSRFVVRGDSMAPTLRDGDLVQTLPQPWLRHGLRRGAVVVARLPGAPGAYSGAMPDAGVRRDTGAGTMAVKRIVGLPGELVRMGADGVILVNDVPLAEPYLAGSAGNGSGRPASSGEHFPAWLCDDDDYFLVGDNRGLRESADSRRYGPASGDSIIGVVKFRWAMPRLMRRERRRSCDQLPAARHGGAR